MFNKKLSNYLSNINKINKTSTNEIFINFCYQIKPSPKVSLSSLLNNDFSHFFYWEQPEKEFSFCAFKPIKKIIANGVDRTIETQTNIGKFNYLTYNNFDKFNLQFAPLFVGGMKFSPGNSSKLWNNFNDSDWFVPKYLFLTKGKSLFFIYNFFYDKSKTEQIIADGKKGLDYLSTINQRHSTNSNFIIKESNFDKDYDKKEWKNAVNTALNRIHNGEIRKVVLSRKVMIKFSRISNISVLIDKLKRRYPRCYVFAYAKDESIFFGASPEKLAKLSDGYIEADALAGSFPRGRTELEDRILSNELLLSKKNRAEQQAVVDSITNSFRNFSSEIIYEKIPVVRKLPNIQHLWTPIRAKLNNGKSVIAILKELHPTPAICGTPYNLALKSIKESEKHDRGLYAGIVGWFNYENQGEFAVAIRSAILKGNELHAFAGCGIVEGSDPDAEYAETKLKLSPIFSLFDYDTTNKS